MKALRRVDADGAAMCAGYEESIVADRHMAFNGGPFDCRLLPSHATRKEIVSFCIRITLTFAFAIVGVTLASNAAADAPPTTRADANAAMKGVQETAANDRRLRELKVANKRWLGDFDKLLERRMIRVLVPYSRSLYYVDRGRERGLTAELVRDFEQYINHKYRQGKRPVTVYLIPTTRDRLLPDLEEGLGDIAAGNLTATPERVNRKNAPRMSAAAR